MSKSFATLVGMEFFLGLVFALLQLSLLYSAINEPHVSFKTYGCNGTIVNYTDVTTPMARAQLSYINWSFCILRSVVLIVSSIVAMDPEFGLQSRIFDQLCVIGLSAFSLYQTSGFSKFDPSSTESIFFGIVDIADYTTILVASGLAVCLCRIGCLGLKLTLPKMPRILMDSPKDSSPEPSNCALFLGGLEFLLGMTFAILQVLTMYAAANAFMKLFYEDCDPSKGSSELAKLTTSFIKAEIRFINLGAGFVKTIVLVLLAATAESIRSSVAFRISGQFVVMILSGLSIYVLNYLTICGGAFLTNVLTATYVVDHIAILVAFVLMIHACATACCHEDLPHQAQVKVPTTTKGEVILKPKLQNPV